MQVSLWKRHLLLQLVTFRFVVLWPLGTRLRSRSNWPLTKHTLPIWLLIKPLQFIIAQVWYWSAIMKIYLRIAALWFISCFCGLWDSTIFLVITRKMHSTYISLGILVISWHIDLKDVSILVPGGWWTASYSSHGLVAASLRLILGQWLLVIGGGLDPVLKHLFLSL